MFQEFTSISSLDGAERLLAAATGPPRGTVDDAASLLAAAAALADIVLAVTLQGLACRRPAVREALLSVWKAEDASGSPAAIPSTMPGTRRVDSTVASSAGPRCGAALGPAQTDVGDIQAAIAAAVDTTLPKAVAASLLQAQPMPLPGDHSAQLLARAGCYAVQAGCREVGTEHLLAASAFMWPEDARSVFGADMHQQLQQLLARSGLEEIPADQPPAAPESHTCGPEVQRLLEACGRGIEEVFRALLCLPDDAAATQLLEMSRIFTQRSKAIEELEFSRNCPEEPAVNGATSFLADSLHCNSTALESPTHDAPALESRGLQAASMASTLRNRTCQFATAAGARSLGTEHVLAAAVEHFPGEAAGAFGGPLVEQLLPLLDRSQLAPPPADAPMDAKLSTAADAEALLDNRGGPSALFEAMQALPDASAASQLVEMAKVFLERS